MTTTSSRDYRNTAVQTAPTTTEASVVASLTGATRANRKGGATVGTRIHYRTKPERDDYGRRVWRVEATQNGNCRVLTRCYSLSDAYNVIRWRRTHPLSEWIGI